MAGSPPKTCHARLIFSWPFKFTSWPYHSPVTDTQSVVQVQTILAQTPCTGKVKLVLRTRCMVQRNKEKKEKGLNSMAAHLWTWEQEECVCLGWGRDRPAASFFEQVLRQPLYWFATSRLGVAKWSCISLNISRFLRNSWHAHFLLSKCNYFIGITCIPAFLSTFYFTF